MATTTTRTNKPILPRGNDASPKGYNRAALYSGKALDFDGVNDKVTSSVNTTIFSDSGTISGYLKLDGLGGIKAGFGFRLSAQSEFYLLFVNNNSEYRMRTTDGHTDVVADLSEFVGRWTLFTCTFGAGVMKLYADGNLLASSNYTGTFVTNSSATYSFGESGSGSFWYDGQASNARVFNTALTAAQVSDLYNNPEKIVPTGVEDTALKLWLPMMEGAGTTAYDGSGNGNHGTISGATYVHGVGSPVAQSAVIDWNKGTNTLRYSEDLSNAVWTKDGATCTANYGTAPDGSQTSTRVQYAAASDNLSQLYTLSDGVVSIWVKGTSGQTIKFGSASSEALFTLNGDWQRIEKYNSGALNFLTINTYSGATARDIEVWGAQMESGTTAGPYVRTGATAQTSPVLLPQGLTSGRDITGVNLFENVRKQGALNLDGNSWAEVHDNASLDLTNNISLECWYYNDGSTDKGLLGKYYSGKLSYLLWASTTQNAVRMFTNNLSSEKTGLSIGWHHVVGTYDGANIKIYVDGVLGNTTAYATDISTSDEAVEIGRYFGSSGVAYPNQIAQPRIYNRALTAEEVLRNYNSEKNTYQ